MGVVGRERVAGVRAISKTIGRVPGDEAYLDDDPDSFLE
jgi:hypothetical protein